MTMRTILVTSLLLFAKALCGAEQAGGTATEDEAVSHLIPITIVVLLALLVPVAILVINRLTTVWQGLDKEQAEHKGEAYECGLRSTVGSAGERFSVKFYLIAMLFLVFDIEVAFLYPFALQFTEQRGWGLFVILLVFLIMLEAAYLYLYRKGALDWER